MSHRSQKVSADICNRDNRLLVEMTGALNSGKMHTLEPRTLQNTTPTSYENFVDESFIPAYQQPAAA